MPLGTHFENFHLENSESQPVSTGFSEWTSVSPLCMPSRKALRKTSYWAFNSHAIDNEHSTLVPWTYNLFDCRQLLPLTSRLVASMSGLANNYSITTLYALYATALWKDPYSSYTSTKQDETQLDLVSGLANLFNHHSVWSTCNYHFGGLDYRPHGSLATIATRTSVSSSYTLRPSNRHYFPSKPLSPSSHIRHPRKRKPYLRCLMAI